MNVKEKIVVLFANPYSVRDEGDGHVSEGISCSYIMGDSLESVMSPNGALGQRPAKGSLKRDLWEKFCSAPGLYEGSFDMNIGSDGKPMLKLVDVDFLSLVSLSVKKAGKPTEKEPENGRF